ncbi:MAG: hypothetical protein NWP98_00455 [Erythrobacter sp.]|nr:hypothetical protein [Erythrobacter sp.]
MANPALLGGMTGILMLAAWALGRWQANLALSFNAPAGLPMPSESQTPSMAPQAWADGSTLYQQHSHPEGAFASNIAMSLCELHAEVSAFRRREKVFATLAPDAFMLDVLLRAKVAEAATPIPNLAGYHRGYA